MLYGTTDTTSIFTGSGNSQIVKNVDPENPVVTDTQDLSSGETFMRLMLEQLKNQDPMNPVDSQGFTQQLAALNTVEQLMTMNATMSNLLQQGQLSDAASLIGTYVEGMDGNQTAVTGVVDHVELVEGEPVLIIGDQLLLLEQLISVSAPDESTEEAS